MCGEVRHQKSSQMFLENHSKPKCNRNVQQPFSTTGFNTELPQTVNKDINANDYWYSKRYKRAYNLGKTSIPVCISKQTAWMMFLNAS